MPNQRLQTGFTVGNAGQSTTSETGLQIRKQKRYREKAARNVRLCFPYTFQLESNIEARPSSKKNGGGGESMNACSVPDSSKRDVQLCVPQRPHDAQLAVNTGQYKNAAITKVYYKSVRKGLLFSHGVTVHDRGVCRSAATIVLKRLESLGSFTITHWCNGGCHRFYRCSLV